MTDRARRQKALAELIRTEALGSQEEVTARLSALGHPATQATVSRDLECLGAVKVKRGGALRYALPGAGETDYQAGRMERIVAEWVRSVEAAGNLLVLKTPPGSAHLVGLVIDQADLPELAGTISGDDTLFVALRDGVVADAMANRFRLMAGLAKPLPFKGGVGVGASEASSSFHGRLPHPNPAALNHAGGMISPAAPKGEGLHLHRSPS